MATWRVILKKTAYLKKGRITSESGRELKRYLARYVDEVGKASQKKGEPWQKLSEGAEVRWLLPDEATGVLYTEGFIGQSKSPGKVESNKQLGWCRRAVDRWVAELIPRTKRRNDGFRFILSLGPKAVEDLTENGISTDQALRDIWREATELYRTRHGWDNPGGELAWICGAHHDTDNAHLHIVLFPTTQNGSPLKTNFRGVGKNKEDHLMEMIGMANIAAEIFWREHMGLEFQSQEFQGLVASNPGEEPPLPRMADFGKKAQVEGKGGKRGKRPKINTGLVAKNMVGDIKLVLGEEKPRKKRRGKGIRRLKAVLAGNEAYGENRKKKFWEAFRGVTKKTAETVEALESDFPDELKALEGLEESISGGKRKPEKELARGWKKKGAEWGWSLLELVLGLGADPDDKRTLAAGAELAERIDASAQSIPENKLKAAWNAATEMGKEARGARNREQRYRQVERQTKKGSAAREVLKSLIRGAARLAHILEARREETRLAIKKTKGGFSKRSIKRDWTAEGKKMVRKESMGPPWPDHFDAATVFEPLAAGKADTGEKEMERELIEEEPERKKGEGILAKLVRIGKPRRATRKGLAKKRALEGPETPDLPE